jgi:hypothetical protein
VQRTHTSQSATNPSAAYCICVSLIFPHDTQNRPDWSRTGSPVSLSYFSERQRRIAAREVVGQISRCAAFVLSARLLVCTLLVRVLFSCSFCCQLKTICHVCFTHGNLEVKTLRGGGGATSYLSSLPTTFHSRRCHFDK